jgi:UDP-N-acetylglucosamine--N-acetylmuramyl-(pentapeptide) pyrophosphoryl-undecaprenol N-acetylglucosamine transferase
VVVFSGGGTGGHLYPALALADALRALRPDVRCFFVGAERGLEARVLPERGAEHLLLPVRGVARGRRLSAVRALPALGRSLLHVAELFHSLRPEAVVVTGGYAGGPAGLVSAARRIPLVLQEQNAVPGVTTRALSRWARQVHLAFPEAAERLPIAARSNVQVSGNPVRPAPSMSAPDARALYQLPAQATVVLVTGGSQGSAALNRVVLEAIAGVTGGALRRPDDLVLLWATGPKNHDEAARGLEASGSPDWVHAQPYIDNMPAALTAADLAVSRAGAMTTAELLNHGLPAVLVPLPSAAANHQALNAEALAQAGAAVVAPEEGLTGAGLWAHLEGLVLDPDQRREMAAAARARACPGAASEIAGAIARLLPEVAK